MSEQKNALSVKIEVDTKEANENIKELTAAVNDCVEAFERLEKKLEKFNSTKLQIGVNNLINPDAVEFAKRALRINGVMV